MCSEAIADYCCILFLFQTSNSFTFLNDPVEESPVEDHPSLNDVKTPSVVKKSKPARLSSDEEDNCDGYFEDTAKNAQSEKPASVAVNDCKRFFFTLSDPRLASSTVGMFHCIFYRIFYIYDMLNNVNL